MHRLDKRLTNLEGPPDHGGVAVVMVEGGETSEEAVDRYFTEHPGMDRNQALTFVMNFGPNP